VRGTHIATLQTQTRTLDETNQALHSQLDDVIKSQQKNNAQLDQLQAQLGIVHEQVGGIRAGATAAKQQWARIEAVYLLRIAQDQLTLGHDVDNATKSLTAALTALGNDITTQYVQQQLTQQLQQLHAVPTSLYSRTEQQLQQAAQSVMHLPLRIQATGNTDESEPLPESGIDLMWLKLRRAVHSLISIRKDTAPILSDGSQLLGKAQLQTLLTQAAWAVRTHNQDSYEAMIKQAIFTLSIVLDTQRADVLNLQQQLHQLSLLNIKPELPDLEQSITALEHNLPKPDRNQP